MSPLLTWTSDICILIFWTHYPSMRFSRASWLCLFRSRDIIVWVSKVQNKMKTKIKIKRSMPSLRPFDESSGLFVSGRIVDVGISIVIGIAWILHGSGGGTLETICSSMKHVPSWRIVSFRLTTDPSDFVSLQIGIVKMPFSDACSCRSNWGSTEYRALAGCFRQEYFAIVVVLCDISKIDHWQNQTKEKINEKNFSRVGDEIFVVVWKINDKLPFHFIYGSIAHT